MVPRNSLTFLCRRVHIQPSCDTDTYIPGIGVLPVYEQGTSQHQNTSKTRDAASYQVISRFIVYPRAGVLRTSLAAGAATRKKFWGPRRS